MIWARLRNAALIAGAAFLSAAPYTYYVSTIAFAENIRNAPRAMTAQEILQFDLTAMAAMVVLAALVGSLASERYGLAGLGDRERVLRAWPFAIVALVYGVLSYFIFGARLAAKVPDYYPTTLVWTLAMMIKGAVFDEVVARYGMMTIVSGVTRRTWVANLLQAIFFTAVGLRSMAFYGVAIELQPFVIGGLVASFLVHFTLGAVYARHGLFAAVLVHLVLEVEKLVNLVLT